MVRRLGLGTLGLSMLTVVCGDPLAVLDAQEVTVPDGFEIAVFADGLQGVRMLRMGPDGQLYAAQSQSGRVVRLDPVSAEVEVVLTGLNRPYGLAFHDGWMYVGERHQVVRLRAPTYDAPEVVVPDIPTRGHWTREVVFGPDGMMYVSVGSSCNVCEESDARRAAVTRYNPDGSGEHIYSEGLRNSVGLAFRPGTDELWASQNERDNLGDDVPPEEINLLIDGAHFGWPYCHSRGVTNPEYRDRAAFCRSTVAPSFEIQAHSAPLGMVFYDGDQFPPEYRGDLFVALHGSWNRSVPTGYKLIRIEFEGGVPVVQRDFASGWLSPAGRVSGRPVAVEVGPDGSLFMSDDDGGRIYRIRWRG